MARSEKSQSFHETLKQIGKGTVRPLYLLNGEEQFLADQVIDAILLAVFNAPKDDFNLHVFHGKDADMTGVLNAAMAFPMMADRKVVILRDADALTKPEREALAAYCNNPMDSTCLVLTAVKADFRYHPFKWLREHGMDVELKALTEYEIPEWIESFAERHGKRISSNAAMMLASRVDVSLRELDSQVDKLATYVGAREEINEDDIETAIGVSRQYNIWEFCQTVGKKDLERAIHVFDQMFRFGEEPVGMVALLHRHFIILMALCDLRERHTPMRTIQQHMIDGFRVYPNYLESQYWPQAASYAVGDFESIFAALLEADTELKSSVMDKTLIMHRLIFRIIKGLKP